jgi:hypothetical protein
MPEYRMVRAWLASRLQRARSRRGDEGAGIVETVIIVGLFAAAAIVIVGVLVAKALDAANSVRTQ